ncbi:hypothetical protein [Paenibacillus sp. MMS20-IR301]|uniref:hypothetical protein n=1 Tax=Paenibacillus sp. MMS20-IR301 TaxID=2895946 RepID=UPI0028E9F49C|nr:hypothetical protein [Paenibacillus sp. MMS20-IR301]WNS47121.1 hypothetical protein LOS79_17275 [Paenibacillus sp. MMS20-IR301]
MSTKGISSVSFPFRSVIIGIFIVLFALIDHYAIKAGQLIDGFGFLSLFFISPIGLIFGSLGLNIKKTRHVSLLGIGINLSAFLFCVLMMTVFYTP